MTRLQQFCELSTFIEKCLVNNGFQEDHLAIFLADFNVDAKGEKHPLDFVAAFEKQEVQTYILNILT